MKPNDVLCSVCGSKPGECPAMKPNDVTCPTCGSKPGEWCMTAKRWHGGRERARQPHRSRFKLSHHKETPQ